MTHAFLTKVTRRLWLTFPFSPGDAIPPPRPDDNKGFALMTRNETRILECMAFNACAICRLVKLRSGERAARGRTSTCTSSFPLRSFTGLQVAQYVSKATSSGICISFPTDSTRKTAGHDNNSTNSNRVGFTFFFHTFPRSPEDARLGQREPRKEHEKIGAARRTARGSGQAAIPHRRSPAGGLSCPR